MNRVLLQQAAMEIIERETDLVQQKSGYISEQSYPSHT